MWAAGYGSLATAFLFFGVGVAFQSGAINAWLVESQLQDGPAGGDGKAGIQKRLALFGAVGNMGKAFGAVLGGVAFSTDVSIPWKVSLGVLALAVVLLLLVDEPPCPKREPGPSSV